MKGSPHGTRKLNALIQERYHAWSKNANRWPVAPISAGR